MSTRSETGPSAAYIQTNGSITRDSLTINIPRFSARRLVIVLSLVILFVATNPENRTNLDKFLSSRRKQNQSGSSTFTKWFKFRTPVERTTNYGLFAVSTSSTNQENTVTISALLHSQVILCRQDSEHEIETSVCNTIGKFNHTSCLVLRCTIWRLRL